MSNPNTITTAAGAITEAEALMNAGMMLAEHARKTLDGHEFVLLPNGTKLQSLEQLQDAPNRPRGTVNLRDMASFVNYVRQRIARAGEEQGSNTLRVYGLLGAKPGFRAVFNDHGKLRAGWRDDVAVFDCPLSDEWTRWTSKNSTKMDQESFATWIEDNLPDIAEPAAADMLEIARSLEAKKKVNFASGLRLSNGEHQITYEEQIDGTAAKGRLQVPEAFALGVPVFEGGDRYRVEARLRYRIADGGKLSMWYDLLRPHKIVEDAARFQWRYIEAELGVTVLNGAVTG